MRTKVILFLGLVALLTLSFTFAHVGNPTKAVVKNTANVAAADPDGFIADQVVK